MKRHFLYHQSGFTLIELVAVMVLLGILAAYAVPRFGGTDTFDAYAAQDQIIAGARLAQQRAMYDHSPDTCYSLDISNGATGDVIQVLKTVEDDVEDDVVTAIGPSPEWRAGIVIDPSIALETKSIFFDGIGNPLNACGGTINSHVISIGQPVLFNVCITTAGYIHAC